METVRTQQPDPYDLLKDCILGTQYVTDYSQTPGKEMKTCYFDSSTQLLDGPLFSAGLQTKPVLL